MCDRLGGEGLCVTGWVERDSCVTGQVERNRPSGRGFICDRLGGQRLVARLCLIVVVMAKLNGLKAGILKMCPSE